MELLRPHLLEYNTLHILQVIPQIGTQYSVLMYTPRLTVQRQRGSGEFDERYLILFLPVKATEKIDHASIILNRAAEERRGRAT